MTYVVTENCINCKHTDCVEVCPAQAFHEGPNFIVINPDECIDCELCVGECPVSAIHADHDLPVDQLDFLRINAEKSLVWPVITEQKTPLDDADAWNGIAGKRRYLAIEQKDITGESSSTTTA
jgi:ferredoxin